MQSIAKALQAFNEENGRFPDNANDGIPVDGQQFDGTGNAIEAAVGKYLSPLPLDPAHDGTTYFYSYVPNRVIDNCDGIQPEDPQGAVIAFHTAETTKFDLNKVVCSAPASLQLQGAADHNVAFILD